MIKPHYGTGSCLHVQTQSLHSFHILSFFQLTAVIDLEVDFPPLETAELCVTLHNDENAGMELTAELNSGDLHLFL